MNLGELKALVEKAYADGALDTTPVEVPVRTWTRAYPVAYVSPFDGTVTHGPGDNPTGKWGVDGLRLYVSLPEGFSVSQRKAAR